MARPPFVGRAQEIARALAVVRSDDRAPLALLGPPGIGKSALLDAIRGRLEAAGLRVQRVVASSAAVDLPLVPFSRFVAGDAASSSDLGTSVARVIDHLRESGAQAPTVLMVDDAHDLDDASVVVVSQLAHSEEVRLVLVARSGEAMPTDLEHLVDGRDVECLEVCPLTRVETDELVRQELGLRALGSPGRTSVSSQVLDAVWTAGEGVPLHVCDLIDSSVRSGALANDEGGRWVQQQPLVPSTRLSDALGRRVEQLGDDGVELVRMLAVAGPVPLHVADSVASPRHRLAAERAGILRRRAADPTGDTVDFAHRVYRVAVSSWMGPAERRRVAAAAALLLEQLPSPSPDDDLLRAELAMRAGDLGAADPAIYERGAEVACHLQYDGGRALRLAEAALSRGAGVRAEVLRLEALGLLRRVDEASAGFAELAANLQDPQDVATVASAYAWHLLLDVGDTGAALAALEVPVDGLSDTVAERLRDQRRITQVLARRAADAVAAAPAVDDPTNTPPALSSALISSLSVVGRAEEASRLAEVTLDALPANEDHRLGELGVVWHRLVARWQLGRLGELRDPFDGLRPQERPWLASVWMRTAMTASFELLRGRLARSAELHEAVWDQVVDGPPQVVAMNSVLHATAQAQLGRHRRASELLAVLDELPRGATARHRWWIARARIQAAAAHGALSDAAHASIELADTHADEQFHVTTSLHDAVRFGRARFVEARLAAQARRADATWWDQICADHAAAAADERPDPARLLDVAARFHRGGRALDALEATAQAVAAAERAPMPSSTRTLGVVAGTRFRALLSECGPVRTPLVVAVPHSLTERELLVARMAASGSTNAEIARRLGTSARTVGNQLQSVYQKLGLHSRDELRFLHE